MFRRILAVALAAAVLTAPPPGVYHPDGAHLWNRLHDALFVRRGPDGQEYGRDRIEPLLWRSSQHFIVGESHARLLAVLAEFNRGGEALVADPLKRALLQRDLWLVFSWLEHDHDGYYGFPAPKEQWSARHHALRQPLAQAIGRLALPARQIAALPDTYAAAVASREFADRFDPAAPARPYLPPDLYAADGPWVALGRGDELVAGSHVLSDNPFTTSAFLVFIKLPAGRPATVAYVDRLRAFDGPLFVSTGAGAAVFPNYNPRIPQFPAGTEVALVRRALMVTSTSEIVASPITENVQVRVYREVANLAATGTLLNEMLVSDRMRSSQAVSEFLLSRARLFAGRSGGLRSALEDEGDFLTGFSTHGHDPFEPRPGDSPFIPRDRLRRQPLGDRCIHCHNLPGVFSFNTFAMNFYRADGGPAGRLSVMKVSDVLASAAAWKRTRPDWQLLRRLLQGSPSRRPR